jgi:hypothetical protein
MSKKLIITTPLDCQQNLCRDINPAYSIKITSITANDAGWLAKGNGHTSRKWKTCEFCGATYMQLKHQVPIICASFDCPQCGKSEELSYKVKNITADEHSFEFEVEIECKVCKKKKSLTKTISQILSILKIEVNPTGISVKKA